MNLRSITRIAQSFGVAVVDQVALSGANFLVGLLLIRKTSDVDYGSYVLAQSAISLLIAAQGAWLYGPLAVVANRQTPERRKEMIGALQGSQSRFLRRGAVALLLIPPLLVVFGAEKVLLGVVSALTILAGWAALQREYLRGTLLIYRRPHALFRADLVYVGVLVAGAVLAAFGPKPAAVTAVSSLAIAAFAGGRAAYAQIKADPGWAPPADAAPYWLELRTLGIWSSVGAIIYWIFSQSYNYVLATRFDLSAVAAINAARLLSSPIIMLTTGTTSLLLPTSSAWLAQHGLTKMLRRLILFLVGVSALDFLYFGFVWYFKDWLTLGLLHKVIADRDRLLLLWFGVAMIGLARDFLQCALLALRSQKSMAWLIGVSAAVSLTIMWFGLGKWGPAAALIGQIVGELVNLAGLVVLLWRQFRSGAGR